MTIFPCPCCGTLVFEQPPGSFRVCLYCGWVDDLIQLRWVGYSGGANKPSLIDAQRSVIDGLEVERARGIFVWECENPPYSGPKDPGWRPIDRKLDWIENDEDRKDDWPEDLTTLYYWRPTFWRLKGSDASSCNF